MEKEQIPYATSIPAVDSVVARLCQTESLQKVWRDAGSGVSMPSLTALQEIMQRLRAIIFPGYFGSSVSARSVRYHLAANLDSVYHLLREQIARGMAFYDAEPRAEHPRMADAATLALLDALPTIRDQLASDANAAYEGDPAAKSPGETIFCYPSLYAMFHHRISHMLYTLNIPMIPRIISEMAHSHTGIDIHPGATIGNNFFIDHGTGVVIGETSVVGDNCRLYQGVTLGALSFPKNADGTLTKGIARHPILERGVTVYAGATILGRITIGEGAVIGGNVWVTHDVSAHTHLLQGRS